jgi:hypothetical protein
MLSLKLENLQGYLQVISIEASSDSGGPEDNEKKAICLNCQVLIYGPLTSWAVRPIFPESLEASALQFSLLARQLLIFFARCWEVFQF